MISILSLFILRKYPRNTFFLFPVLTAVCKTRVAHGSLSHEVGGLPEISTCLSRSPLILLLASCADVSDLQRGESGERPSSLCSPELRQPRRSPAQSVCRWQPSLLRGEALAQELPLWSLWLVDDILGCQLPTFLFSLSAAALWCCYSYLFLLAFISFSRPPNPILLTIIYCVFPFSPSNYNCDYTFAYAERETIFFNSQQVSKPESSCDLTSVSNV